MRRKMLTSVSFAVTGSLLLVIACSEDTGTSQIPSGASAGAAGTTGAAGGAGGATGGVGTGGSSGSLGKGGAGGAGGTAGTGTGGTAGTMSNDDEAECGNQPMPGDSCTGTGQCDGSRRCSCTNGMVTGQTCGQQFQQQQQGNNGGAGGMAAGGIDCGASPSNGDSCPAPGVCMSGMGCQCAAGLLTVYGCTGDGGGGEGPGEGGGPGTGGSSGSGGSSGNGGNGGGMSGAGGAGVNCGSNPDTGEPCTGGPGICPNDDTCICTAPPNGMVQCQ